MSPPSGTEQLGRRPSRRFSLGVGCLVIGLLIASVAVLVIIKVVLVVGQSIHREVHLDEPLLMAAADGDTARVRHLIAQGANVNAADEDGGDTALMFAAANGRADTVAELLKAGADVHKKNRGGATALLQARLHGGRQVVELLLRAGAR